MNETKAKMSSIYRICLSGHLTMAAPPFLISIIDVFEFSPLKTTIIPDIKAERGSNYVLKRRTMESLPARKPP